LNHFIISDVKRKKRVSRLALNQVERERLDEQVNQALNKAGFALSQEAVARL